MGTTIPVCGHIIGLSLSLHYLPAKLSHAQRILIALFMVYSRCGVKFSLASSMIPKYLASSFIYNFCSHIVNPLMLSFLRHVKGT